MGGLVAAARQQWPWSRLLAGTAGKAARSYLAGNRVLGVPLAGLPTKGCPACHGLFWHATLVVVQ